MKWRYQAELHQFDFFDYLPFLIVYIYDILDGKMASLRQFNITYKIFASADHSSP